MVVQSVPRPHHASLVPTLCSAEATALGPCKPRAAEMSEKRKSWFNVKESACS